MRLEKKLLWAVSLFISFYCEAGEGDYPANAIPGRLLKNANTVKRMDNTEFRIIDLDQAVMVRRYAITVLNEKGAEDARLVAWYDKLVHLRSIRGRLYDASGKIIRTLKTREVEDRSAADDELVTDRRFKTHQFTCRSYPYTVEYEIETRYDFTMFFPHWLPQQNSSMAVEQSSFTIICDTSYAVRYKAFNYKGQPVVEIDAKKKKLNWKLGELPAYAPPFAPPDQRELTTVVYFAPTEFQIQGYRGNMNSWEELGRFQYRLSDGRDALPDHIVQKLAQLTSGINDRKEKLKLVYNFLQQSTRYVSIQLGLGGWQPFDASFVAQKGYGDCKALSNYMRSLLKVVGIRSHCALVQAGEGAESYLLEDFPSLQFNHMILCVPLDSDTVWLECTSQAMPAGYLGEFTGNRKALLIHESGGSLVSTPRYSMEDNFTSRKIVATLANDGRLEMNVRTTYRGIQQDRLGAVLDLSKDRVEELLHQSLELSTYRVNHFSYRRSDSMMPELGEIMDLTVDGYASITGKRLFIIPNILNRGGRRLEVDEERTVDMVFAEAYREKDDYEIELPRGYLPESLPKPVSLRSKFGSYSSKAILEGNRIVYSRTLERYSGRFPSSEQQEFVSFCNAVFEADRNRMVLVKSDE